MKGMFIVFEGIDGCGKSTQINHLSEWLPESGLMPKKSKLLITREPGGTILGNSIRKLLLNNSKEESPQPVTELLLYAADRAQHVNQVIVPAIQNGDWVISDRFSSSTMAYQGFGRDLNKILIKRLEEISTQGLKPDITFLLNLTVSESIQRRVSKEEDRIESEGKLFLEKVAYGFKSIATREDWITISADKKEALVRKEIQDNLRHILSNFK